MELIAFRIRMYRGIIDSGWVKVNPLTVFVGKNESGKTSLLKALHKLNPYTPEPYDIKNEWPRSRRSESSKEHVVCCAKFRLLDQENLELREIAERKSIPNIVEVSRNYAGHRKIKIGPNVFVDKPSPVDVDTIMADLPDVQNNFSNRFRECANDCLAEVRHFIHEKQFAELELLVDKHEKLLRRNRIDEEYFSYSDEGRFINRYLPKLRQLTQEVPELPAPRPTVFEYIIERLPTFVYMDDYRIFSGSAHLIDVQTRKNEDRLTEEDRTFLTILEVSGLDLDELIGTGQKNSQIISRERRLDIRGGAGRLTEKMSGLFRQRDYVFEFDVDNPYFFTFVSDDIDTSPIELKERSRGFQWDFSFNLMMMHETEETFEGCVILLDEPGLHLHPESQEAHLKRLEEYATKNTLLYTTHLPFMIDRNHPDRIRILKETKDKGIVVTTDLIGTSPDSRLVLQAALGMSAAQSFLVAKRNLVVEGVDDYWILTELSELLQQDGMDGLSEDVLITPGPSASQAVHVATFMIGQNLDVVALFDSDQAGRDAKDELVKRWLTGYKASHTDAILLGDAVGANGDFALEDLFTEDFYLEVVKETYPKVKEITLQDEGMLWKRVEGALKRKRIKANKGSVAKRLRKRLSAMKDTSELPEKTKEKAVMLFQAIRKAFGEEDTKSS